MTGILNTGNKTVDAIGQMNLSGNVTPPNWYKTILRDNGKPYLLAICILSEICYWYRPKEVRDEQTGFVVEYRKRFKEDLLQKNYQQLADQFGESKRTIKAAMDRLEEIGVITRVWRNKVLQNGVSLTNILYIDLNEEKLYELTYGVSEEIHPDNSSSDNDDEDDYEEDFDSFEEENDEKQPANPVNKHVTKFCTTLLQNNVGGPTKNCTTLLQNNVGGPTKNCNTLLQNNVRGLTENCRTYTENNSENILEITTENTNDITNSFNDGQSNHIASGNPSFETASMMDRMRMAEALIKENIDYDVLVDRHKLHVKRIDELIEIMVETIAFGKDIKIKNNVIPYAMVRSRFEKYDYMVMEYVLETLSNNTTKVHNLKQYLLAALYNAPSTIDNYYSFEVNHDMSQPEWGVKD